MFFEVYLDARRTKTSQPCSYHSRTDPGARPSFFRILAGMEICPCAVILDSAIRMPQVSFHYPGNANSGVIQRSKLSNHTLRGVCNYALEWPVTKISVLMAWWILPLVTRFFLVSKCENTHGVAIGLVSIECHIPGIAKCDKQFAQFRQVIKWPADLRVRFQKGELLGDGLPGASRCRGVFFCQEFSAVLQSFSSTRCNNYSWHSGISSSFSAPQVSSQSRTSVFVRCCPVS